VRDWEQKERPKPPMSEDSVETDAPEAEGGIWERYGPAVLAVILVTVTAGICNSLANLSPR
jgi:hypothetical protein